VSSPSSGEQIFHLSPPQAFFLAELDVVPVRRGWATALARESARLGCGAQRDDDNDGRRATATHDDDGTMAPVEDAAAYDDIGAISLGRRLLADGGGNRSRGGVAAADRGGAGGGDRGGGGADRGGGRRRLTSMGGGGRLDGRRRSRRAAGGGGDDDDGRFWQLGSPPRHHPSFGALDQKLDQHLNGNALYLLGCAPFAEYRCAVQRRYPAFAPECARVAGCGTGAAQQATIEQYAGVA